MNLNKIIARAIKKADRSYFFENYEKQAESVLRLLDQEGYMILPKEPSKDLLKKVAETMATGKMKPEEHVKDVYEKILGQWQG
jgi:predicted CoA-binding protein